MKRQVWSVGKSPLQSLFMMGFVAYMSGSHITIMSVMMCGMLFVTPARALMNRHQPFARFESHLKGESVLWQSKALFMSIHLTILALAFWKFAKLGILPVTPADWIRSDWFPVDRSVSVIQESIGQ